jgi:phosphotransacetylase
MSARSWPAAACTRVAALSLMILEDGPLFIADTHVHPNPRRNRSWKP